MNYHSKKLVCEQCGAVFDTYKERNAHKAIHRPIVQRSNSDDHNDSEYLPHY